jgi:hypothetical protein
MFDNRRIAMSDRTDNRTLARWLIARYKRKKMAERFADEMNKEALTAALAESTQDIVPLPDNPPAVHFSAEDRFDFVLCCPADEIRAHGMGLDLTL